MVYGRRRNALSGNTRRRRRAPLNRRRKGRYSSLTVRRPTGIPDRMTTNLVYHDNFTLATVGAGVPVQRIYRGNGCHDPDNRVGFGHQPMFWDTYAALYYHYTVWASSISVVAINAEGGIPQGNVLAVLPMRSDNTVGVMTTAQEQPRAKSRLLSSQGNPVSIFSKITSKQMLPRWSSTQLAVTAFDPAEQWYWHIITEGETAGEESTVHVKLRINYKVTFYERKWQAQN